MTFQGKQNKQTTKHANQFFFVFFFQYQDYKLWHLTVCQAHLEQLDNFLSLFLFVQHKNVYIFL